MSLAWLHFWQWAQTKRREGGLVLSGQFPHFGPYQPSPESYGKRYAFPTADYDGLGVGLTSA